MDIFCSRTNETVFNAPRAHYTMSLIRQTTPHDCLRLCQWLRPTSVHSVSLMDVFCQFFVVPSNTITIGFCRTSCNGQTKNGSTNIFYIQMNFVKANFIKTNNSLRRSKSSVPNRVLLILTKIQLFKSKYLC